MGSNQRHAECVNLLEQRLEAFVFGDPCQDIRDQVFGNMDRACLASVLIRQALGLMQWATALAATSRATAAHSHAAARGSQNGPVAGQPFEPAIQHATDECRVLRNAHSQLQKQAQKQQ